ncbi:MAG: PilW family protein [Pseudomonadota bacterium]
MHSSHYAALKRARGFSLAELMVSVTIGLLILAGMVTLFSNNARTQSEVERANLQIENGRFTIQTIGADLVNAGYYAEFDPTTMAVPADIPNPCSLTLADIRAALPLHIQGVDNLNSTNTPACLALLSPKTGTDVLVVRRVQTCEVGTGNCAPTSDGGAFFQAALCGNADQLESTVDNHYRLDTDTAQMTRSKRNCTTVATVRRFLTHIYFVSNNSVGTDGIPTLKRLELGGSPLAFTLVPLVEGVENLQFEHGIDYNDNGTPDSFSADPGAAIHPTTSAACSAAACRVANWRNTVAVRMHVLARNLEASTTVPLAKTYTMGFNVNNSANTYTPGTTDKFRRHLFQTTVHMSNPAGRKTP